MLAVLLNKPHTLEEWNVYSFHHRQSHLAIIQAIKAQQNVTLPDYQIEPINFAAPRLFLEANQQFHTDMDNQLKAQASDLEDVNLADDHQLQAWIYSHYLEHQTAEARLGIAS